MILAAQYVLPISSPPIEDGAVLVRGDRIVAVGPRAEIEAANPDEMVRDFGKTVILPGFVDLHTHLEYSMFRGLVDDLPYSKWKIQVYGMESSLAPEDWEDAAVLGAAETVQSGITTIADITSSGASARAAAELGMRGVIYREVQTMQRREVDAVMSAAKDDVQAWRESYGDGGLLTVGLAPHSPYRCHPLIFQEASEWAIADGLPVSIHLAGSKDEHDFVKYGSSELATDLQPDASGTDWMPTGVSPVRYVLQWGLFDVPNVLAVHCVWVDDADADVLASHDVAVATCPRCAAKLGMGRTPLGKFFDRGMRVGFGTDSPASNNTIDFFDEMRIALLFQRTVSSDQHFYTAERLVKMATLGGAEALKMQGEIGSLEPGKAADIIGVDVSHSHQIPLRNPYSALVHTANQENVLFTMVAGKTLFEQGKPMDVDEERCQARAEEIRGKLQD